MATERNKHLNDKSEGSSASQQEGREFNSCTLPLPVFHIMLTVAEAVEQQSCLLQVLYEMVKYQTGKKYVCSRGVCIFLDQVRGRQSGRVTF